MTKPFNTWFQEELTKSKTIDKSQFIRDNTEAKIYKFVRVIEILAIDKDEALEKLSSDYRDFGLSHMNEDNFPLKKVSKLTKRAEQEWEAFNCMFTCKKCKGVIFGTSDMNKTCKDHFEDGGGMKID